MSLATIAQLKLRYDSRLVDQLGNDDNTDSENTSVVQAALDDATADIKSAAMRGGVYTESQIDDLGTAADGVVVRLCSDLAMRALFNRRGQGVSPGFEQQINKSVALLEAIKLGGRVLNVSAALASDTPVVATYTAQQMTNLDSMAASSFFGGSRDTRTING